MGISPRPRDDIVVGDYNAFLEAAQNETNELAERFYSFLDFDTCKSNVYAEKLNL